jgi:glycosyltransferase involved in cell wall biosynthesis
MAKGLARMMKDCGAEPHVHYDGIAQLMRPQSINFSSVRSLAGSTGRLFGNRRKFSAFVDRLRGTDLIVVVSHVPSSFSPSLIPNVEVLRRLMPDVPIVNYDLVYLPSLDSWSRSILRNEKTGLSTEDLKIFAKGKFGMERYDWYLMASVGGYIPLSARQHPMSLIGIDIDDGRLYPEQHGEFQVLVDFPQLRGKYPQFREVQMEAIRLAGVKHEQLQGKYTRDEMLAVYRRSGALMLGHAESFGLPICEAQACGCLIFTPDPHWPTAHWLGRDYMSKRAPTFTENFVVYENDPALLAAELKKAAANFNPERVRARFLEQQPELFRGDRAALSDFLGKVKSGEVHSTLHPEHRNVGREKTA